ncbi:MAG: sigma-70 family RNA polymerase sigma factor [Candidatus Poribacteria bacterium]|nr:sigma-70 family RNA polymerase sigma factor [Candidatus Poribacteria bacterium]
MTFTQKSITSYTDTELEQIDEDSLVNQFQSGDTEAFNPLMLKYQKKIYNLMYQRVRDQETAKDLCQEVFLKAFNALPNFKGGSAFYSWIYRIAINCSIDFQRKRNRDKVLTFEELPPEADEVLRMTDDHPSPEQLLDEKELGLIIRKAVKKLPPGQRRVFNLRHRRELAIKEIAALLNRSEGTVKAHLHHAHRQLQGMLLPYLRNEPLEWNGEIQ